LCLIILESGFLIAVSVSAKTVLTPFGFRPEECVLEVPSGATVIPGEGNNLIVKIPATETTEEKVMNYAAPAVCSQDIENIREKKRILRDNSGDVKNQLPTQTNGWLDYVGWYPPTGENNLKSFTSTYVVPQDPTNNQGSQVLFYFIGMQDNDSPSALNIIQPVLTWGNGYNQWYVKSWACCPKNITVSSPPVFGLQAGSEVQGVISRESNSNWLIDSVFNGQHTSLNAQVGDYIYNWADITLEVYYVNNCPDFAKGKAYFNKLVLSDSQGQTIPPNWNDYSGTTICGGSIGSNGADSYYIEHTGA
jgi:hypothetical protein